MVVIGAFGFRWAEISERIPVPVPISRTDEASFKSAQLPNKTLSVPTFIADRDWWTANFRKEKLCFGMKLAVFFSKNGSKNSLFQVLYHIGIEEIGKDSVPL